MEHRDTVTDERKRNAGNQAFYANTVHCAKKNNPPNNAHSEG